MIQMIATAPKTVTRFHPVSAPDYLPIPQMRDLQLARLQATVHRAFDNVPLMNERMKKHGVQPEDIETLDDISRLPFTVKADLRDTYPYGLFACPLSEIVRLHASSGTTGKPIVVAYTQEDLAVWTSVMARALASYGVTRNDIFQNAHGYGLFTGGLGFHYGVEALGATVIPISGGNTDRQIMLMKDLKVTAVCATPSYFVHMLERAAEMGIDVRELPLAKGGFGGEPWTESMRRHMQAGSGIKAYDCYGISEITGPGVAAECWFQGGPHVFEDHFYPEIIDPETGRQLPEGVEGDDSQQAGHADDPLPHARHHGARRRAVPLRTHYPAHPQDRPPQRRHADHSGREHLPVAGRVRAAGGGRNAAALPDRPHARQGPGPDGSPGRGDAGGLRRPHARPRRPARKAVAGDGDDARVAGDGEAGGAAQPATERGQSEARDRPAERIARRT
jgi:hypothetical protein